MEGHFVPGLPETAARSIAGAASGCSALESTAVGIPQLIAGSFRTSTLPQIQAWILPQQSFVSP